MHRRVSVLARVGPLRGAPPKTNHKPRIAFHQSMRPPFSPEVDFSALGLRFPVTQLETVNNPAVPRTEWSPKPESTPSHLPFAIERTTVGDQLPVYTDFRHGRTKVVTQLRRIRGDVQALKEDMEKVCGAEVTITPGKLQVDGNYVRRVKRWLNGLGF
jgi:translation initiation factor 1 (eIF-1/SUI1)